MNGSRERDGSDRARPQAELTGEIEDLCAELAAATARLDAGPLLACLHAVAAEMAPAQIAAAAASHAAAAQRGMDPRLVRAQSC